jgi:hypothetical protein
MRDPFCRNTFENLHHFADFDPFRKQIKMEISIHPEDLIAFRAELEEGKFYTFVQNPDDPTEYRVVQAVAATPSGVPNSFAVLVQDCGEAISC